MRSTPDGRNHRSDTDSPSDGRDQTQRELEISRDLWEAELDEQDILDFIAEGGYDDLAAICRKYLTT